MNYYNYMTLDEINNIRKKSGLPSLPSYTQNQGAVSETINDIKQTGAALKNTFSSTMDKIGEANQAMANGEQGYLRTAGQNIGTLAGGVSKGIGDIITGGAKVLLPQSAETGIKTGIAKSVQAITPIAQKIDQSLGNPVGTFISKYQSLDDKSKRDVDALLGVGSLAVNIATIGAGKKATETVVKKGLEVGTDAGKKLLTTGEKAAGNTLATTGAVLEKTGKRSISTLFPPSESQVVGLTAYKAKNPLLERMGQAAKGVEKPPITPADVALKYNLIGASRTEIAAKAKRVTDKMWKEVVDPALSGIKEKVKKETIFSGIRKNISKISDISQRKSYQRALDALADDYKHISEFSYKTLDNIKSGMAKKLPTKVWQGQDIAGDVNNIRKMFSDEARKIVRSKLDDTVKTIYDEYGSLKEIVKVGGKAYRQGTFGSGWLGVTSELGRTVGTPVVTLGGKALDVGGKLLKKAGQKLLK